LWRVSSTRLRHRRHVDSRAAAKATGKQGTQGRLLLLCLPTPAVRVTVTCNNKKNTQMAVGFNFSFLYRSTSLSLLLHFGSASLYRSVLFLCFLILLCFRWQRSWRCRRCGPGVDGFRSSWYIWRRPWKERWRPVCAKESWWMRKGTASVGAAVSTAAGFFGGRRL